MIKLLIKQIKDPRDNPPKTIHKKNWKSTQNDIYTFMPRLMAVKYKQKFELNQTVLRSEKICTKREISFELETCRLIKNIYRRDLTY